LLVPFPFVSLHTPTWVSWVFWFSWLFLYLVQEVLTSGSSAIVIIYTRGKSKVISTLDQFRLLFFAIFFFTTAIAALSFYLWQTAVKFPDQSAAWFQCLLTARPNSTKLSDCSKIKPQIQIGLYWWTIITLAIIGIYIFILFGMVSHRIRCAFCIGVKNVMKSKSWKDFFKYNDPESEDSSGDIGMSGGTAQISS